jgi:hypothetical protein
MSTEIVKQEVEPSPLPPPEEDVVVLARNPQEVEQAHDGLLRWAVRKIEIEKALLLDAEAGLTHARRMKLKLSGWENQVRAAQKRVDYYTKIHGAIDAGYCIVPNFPTQLIAVRTDRQRPPNAMETSNWGAPSLSPVQRRELPEGAGRYVSPDPVRKDWDENVMQNDGTKKIVHKAMAIHMDEEIDFPMKLVRPQVLSDLDRAMQLKLFDEIGFLPASNTAIRRGDPMVIGRVCMSRGYQERSVSFLITWWIDTRTL